MNKEEKLRVLNALFSNTSRESAKLLTLLDHGEDILDGDEVYNDDFGEWERITKSGGKVGLKDVVRRITVNANSLLEKLVAVYELADRDVTSPLWWGRMDLFISQAKRHLGQKTIEMYERE